MKFGQLIDHYVLIRLERVVCVCCHWSSVLLAELSEMSLHPEVTHNSSYLAFGSTDMHGSLVQPIMKGLKCLP